MSLWRFPNDVSYWFFLSFMRLRRIFSLCFLFTKILRYLIVFSWFNKDFFYLWGLRFTAKDPRLFANSTHVYAIFAKKKIMYSNFQKNLIWKKRWTALVVEYPKLIALKLTLYIYIYVYESNCYLDMLCMYINAIVYDRTRGKMGVGRNLLYNDL